MKCPHCGTEGRINHVVMRCYNLEAFVAGFAGEELLYEDDGYHSCSEDAESITCLNDECDGQWTSVEEFLTCVFAQNHEEECAASV